MKDKRIYDKEREQDCCAAEHNQAKQKQEQPPIQSQLDSCCSTHTHISSDHNDDDGHDHTAGDQSLFQLFLPAIFSLFLLFVAIAIDNWFPQNWFVGWLRIVWYVCAYIPVGYPVCKEALASIRKGDVFSEFLLMTIATVGAFAIGEFPEGVAVMLFYTIGENFQSLAVRKAKTNIKSLMDQRPDEATILENGKTSVKKAKDVSIGAIIQLKPGEKLALDGELISESASFNTAALTGESKPDTKSQGEVVLAGMVNLHTLAQVKVTTAYTDSKLSRILELVQNAVAQKAPTELFIRKFAKIYTPIVVLLATFICVVPYFFVQDYVFSQWLYRALVFLVISCPCALVISIPLGYFGGIGAASKYGILFKGSNFLDIMASVKHVVMDKTGTLTEGVFKVQKVAISAGFDREDILQMVNVLESHSTHPIARAIHDFVGPVNSDLSMTNMEEIAGYGLKATVVGKELLVGNFKLLDRQGVSFDIDPDSIVDTVLVIACDKQFVGYITIADQIKADAKDAIMALHRLHVKTTLLSGDKNTIVQDVAGKLDVGAAYGNLLPEDKVIKVQEIKAKGETVAFVGDGVNVAPVIAWSDVGIAMGGLGSDAAIETADVVIQDDKPSKLPIAIRIGKETKKIVWQNIALAFAVKAIVLLLGASGLATMWEAVFADVGVALLAILNAVRIQRMKF